MRRGGREGPDVGSVRVAPCRARSRLAPLVVAPLLVAVVVAAGIAEQQAEVEVDEPAHEPLEQ